MDNNIYKVVRKATKADLDDLSKIFDAYRVYYKQQSDVLLARKFLAERMANKESEIFIYVLNDQILGFTQLYPTFSSVSAERSHILNDLYVLDSRRGEGIGKSLLSKAKEYVKMENGKGLALETAHNNPARRLYSREGWIENTEYIHYFWSNKK